MQFIYEDTKPLDKGVIEKYSLTEDILMENAAEGILDLLKKLYDEKKLKRKAKIFIVTGSGDNGGDGFVLARKLLRYDTDLYMCKIKEPKSESCIRQAKRFDLLKNYAEKNYTEIVAKYLTLDDLYEFCKKPFQKKDAVLIDCIFGTGYVNKEKQKHATKDILTKDVFIMLNNFSGTKIACDIPSGVDKTGFADFAFEADYTVTMGALKTSLFSDSVKNCVGKIIVADLGIQRAFFETLQTNVFMLEEKDLILPRREKPNVHKGNFGHCAVIVGEKSGAAIICAKAAMAFGAGLVTLVKSEKSNFQNTEYELMCDTIIPENTTCVALGMGLGKNDVSRTKIIFDWLEKNPQVSVVLDADIFYEKSLSAFLAKRKNIVLTPHPKEFQSVLEICGFGAYNIEEIVQNRIEFVKAFCKKYPGVVLLLKGANMLIGFQEEKNIEPCIFINSLGHQRLAKGGSGDVLAGTIAAILTQRSKHYLSYDSFCHDICSATLAFTLASQKISTTYGMTPIMLVEKLRELE